MHELTLLNGSSFIYRGLIQIGRTKTCRYMKDYTSVRKIIQIHGLYLNSFFEISFSIEIIIKELTAKNGGHVKPGSTAIQWIRFAGSISISPSALDIDSQFCIQLVTLISTSTTRIPFIPWLYVFSIHRANNFLSNDAHLRGFDDVDGRERGQKKTDDLRDMTTLGARTLPIM